MTGKIYDNWTDEDWQILFRSPQVPRYHARLSHLKMVRFGDRRDADCMRLATLTKTALPDLDYPAYRNAQVEKEANELQVPY